MTKFEVVVTGNRSLYRSIYESIDRTTTHRTATGAARSILKVERDAKTWARTCGQWGGYTVRIDGRDLPGDIAMEVWAILSDKWPHSNFVAEIAEAIEKLQSEQTA